MSRYGAVVKMWQDWNVRTVDDLALRLDSFRILFAYNSGKIENAEINYHDTREIFENGKVVGYTGSTRTLFEQQNQKVCCDFLQEKIVAKEPLSIELICAVHRALTEGTYDERRYIVNGERPGEFKKHDYVTGKNEVGSQPDEVERDLAELESKMIAEDNERVINELFRKISALKSKLDMLNVRRSNYSACFGVLDIIYANASEILAAGQFSMEETAKAKVLLNLGKLLLHIGEARAPL